MKGKDAIIEFNLKIIKPQKAKMPHQLFPICASNSYLNVFRGLIHHITDKKTNK